MKPAHLNCGTFAGTVDSISELQTSRSGRPMLKCLLNTTNDDDERTPKGDLGEIHRCIAVGELAEDLFKRIRSGAGLRVEGPLQVNGRARRALHQRIATVVVQSATVLRRAPTASEVLTRMFRQDDDKHGRLPTPGQNEVHLIGKVVSLDNDGVIARLTLSTRFPFTATHDIVFWNEPRLAVLRVGAIAEVRGVLFHRIEHWDDGQIRLLSRVHSEDVTVLDATAPASASPLLVTGVGARRIDGLRLN